jgi:nucleotide-binding universal stress UspA family protein
MAAHPILVGVDGSPQSGSAAEAGWQLAQATGLNCQLVHVISGARSALEMAGAGIVLEEFELAMRARARAEVLEGIRGRVPPRVADQLILREGRPSSVLKQIALETDAHTLVLGGKHHSTLGRWLGGSTVQQVVRGVNAPLLVTAGGLPRHPRVMVAIDVSYAARATLDRAVTFAALHQSPLRALHVIEEARDVPKAILRPSTLNYEDWCLERLERDLWPLLPIPDSHKVIRRGPVVEAIATEAAAWGADVLVLGSHGKGWVDRLLLGSVTEALLNDLPAALLIVPVRVPVRETVPEKTQFRPTAVAD